MTEVELLAITLARGRPPAKKDGLARKKKIKNKGHEKDLLQKKSFRSSPVGKTYDAEDVSKKAKTSTDQYKHTKDPKPEGGCQIFYSADFLPITWRNPNNFLLFSKHHLNRRFSTLSLATLSRLSRNFANFMYDIMNPQIIWIFS